MMCGSGALTLFRFSSGSPTTWKLGVLHDPHAQHLKVLPCDQFREAFLNVGSSQQKLTAAYHGQGTKLIACTAEPLTRAASRRLRTELMWLARGWR